MTFFCLLFFLIQNNVIITNQGFSLTEEKELELERGLQNIFNDIPKIEAKYLGDVENKLQLLDYREEYDLNHVGNLFNEKNKRDSGCPGGEGNYGFNSFNFMTFTLLVFSLVANVNNNLNNNNNNANKNNINAINQDSNNVATNINSINQMMVVVLPIPGQQTFPPALALIATSTLISNLTTTTTNI